MTEVSDHLKEMSKDYWSLATHLVDDHNQSVTEVYNTQLGRLDDMHRRLHGYA